MHTLKQMILSRYTLGFYNKRLMLTLGARITKCAFMFFSDLLPNSYGILPTLLSFFHLLKTILFTPVDKVSCVESQWGDIYTNVLPGTEERTVLCLLRVRVRDSFCSSDSKKPAEETCAPDTPQIEVGVLFSWLLPGLSLASPCCGGSPVNLLFYSVHSRLGS